LILEVLNVRQVPSRWSRHNRFFYKLTQIPKRFHPIQQMIAAPYRPCSLPDAAIAMVPEKGEKRHFSESTISTTSKWTRIPRVSFPVGIHHTYVIGGFLETVNPNPQRVRETNSGIPQFSFFLQNRTEGNQLLQIGHNHCFMLFYICFDLFSEGSLLFDHRQPHILLFDFVSYCPQR
jgi:hypothetical protein